MIQDGSESLTLPLEHAAITAHFKNRLPTLEEVESLKQYVLTQDFTPWNPSSLSDQVSEVLSTIHRK
jgi:hypothetical protein